MEGVEVWWRCGGRRGGVVDGGRRGGVVDGGVCLTLCTSLLMCRKIQEETLRTYIFAYGEIYDTLRLVCVYGGISMLS